MNRESSSSSQEDAEMEAVNNFMLSLGITPPAKSAERVSNEPSSEIAEAASYILGQTQNTSEAIQLAESYAAEHGTDAKALKMAIWRQEAERSNAEFMARVADSRARMAAINARARIMDMLLEGVIRGACNPDELARLKREANSIEVQAA